MVGASMHFPVWPFVIFLVLLFGTGFGAGYGCASYDYRPHIEIRKMK